MNEENQVIETTVEESTQDTEQVQENQQQNAIPVEFHLSGDRVTTITVDREAVINNIESFQKDINSLLSMLQDVISVKDDNRDNVQKGVINSAAAYLVNMNIQLVDYFRMDVDEFRLATTMVMDAIIAANTLVQVAVNTKTDNETE